MKICPNCGREFGDANTLCPNDGAVLRKEKDELVGQILAGKYRVEDRIDEGGMGAVYRATHILMEKTVAIKVLHPALAADDKIVARFTREAKAASRISHPHALNVTDFGEDENGVVYLVMEYIRGRTLKDVIRAEGPMPLERVVEIIRQVCGALDAAHSEGVVHRDLKSDNIMLEEAGGGDWAKVLDFGIAKIQEVGKKDPGLTAPNLIIGTPQYMSPEQCAQAAEIDSRSDIYSLGIILYEMLVGHVPFTGDSPTAIMMKHLQEPAPSVLEERQDVPPAVARVIARALSKRPEDRQQSARELSEDFALAAQGKEPVEAAAVAAVADAERELRDTNRIVVPTAPNEAPRTTANEEYDEATVVQPRVMTGEQEVPSILDPRPVPPPSSGFNPIRIIIPALAVLAVVFGLVYFFQRGTNGTSGQQEQGQQPLTVDPRGQPVQAAPPVSGENERNITPGTLASPVQTEGIPAGGQGTTTAGTNTGTNPSGNVNPDAAASPAPTGGQKGGDRNQNGDDNAAQTEDNEGEETEPTPEPSKNTNRRRGTPPVLVNPTPSEDDDDDAPPPPKPKQEKQEKPASTPPPAGPAENSTAPADSAPLPN